MNLLRLSDRGGFTLARAGDLDGTPYGILSHTWGPQEEDEVTFEDVKRGSGKEKAGYAKITFCVERAKENDLKHFWIDSCCIDRPNNTELTEAINSMFGWYKAAAKCFVYLQDVSASNAMAAAYRVIGRLHFERAGGSSAVVCTTSRGSAFERSIKVCD